ncbi:hypothetical protein M9H77_06534 [Catharanthus roseus]|uniref:Uncharacterized protein n=1 Tax=Catharanthus roseus TaxID=4058 RepID=A0ACC0BSL3_CATRO|nr:hypothetical protein M9H77_06534 [Catharanthus roseus]
MAMCENWQVFVHDGRHNHAIGVYTHGHAQVAKLMEEQLIQIEQFRKSHVPPHNILLFFQEQNVGCAVSAQKIYNIVVKINKNRIQGRNTVEEVLCLSAIRDYTVFYRNREDNNMLSDIVVAHPTSIEMLRTWQCVLIMDTTYKRNKYNILLLEVVGMTPTGKNFTVASAFMRNEQAMTCRWVLQQIKHLYFSNTMSTENQEDFCETMQKVVSQFVNGSWKKLLDEIDEQEYLRKLDALKTKWKSRSDFLRYLFNNWLNPFAHKFMRYWTKSHIYFGVETTNRAESEHSVLKLWLSTCHGDLNTVFLNIDSLIEGQIADIKASLEFSKTKEKNNAKSNHIFYILGNRDMDFEMRSLTDLSHQISTGPISKVREMHRFAKGVLNPVLPEDLGVTLTSPPEVVVTKGRKKTDSNKKRQVTLGARVNCSSKDTEVKMICFWFWHWIWVVARFGFWVRIPWERETATSS